MLESPPSFVEWFLLEGFTCGGQYRILGRALDTKWWLSELSNSLRMAASSLSHFFQIHRKLFEFQQIENSRKNKIEEKKMKFKESHQCLYHNSVISRDISVDGIPKWKWKSKSLISVSVAVVTDLKNSLNVFWANVQCVHMLQSPALLHRTKCRVAENAINWKMLRKKMKKYEKKTRRKKCLKIDNHIPQM